MYTKPLHCPAHGPFNTVTMTILSFNMNLGGDIHQSILVCVPLVTGLSTMILRGEIFSPNRAIQVRITTLSS